VEETWAPIVDTIADHEIAGPVKVIAALRPDPLCLLATLRVSSGAIERERFPARSRGCGDSRYQQSYLDLREHDVSFEISKNAPCGVFAAEAPI